MVRLLEREEELGQLAALVEQAAAGVGSVALIGGEAGIGKTSLVRALRDRLPGEVSFLLGACEPLSVPVPLAPLRELVDEAGGGDLHGDDRLALARSVLGALRQRSPAVAAIEDAHWADPLTLDLIRMLASRIEPTGITLLVTYRDDEVASNPALALLLGDLATNPVARRLTLRPLSGDAISALVAAAGLDAAEVQRVTGGNPFLVTETLATGRGLPASVRDAVLARAGRLSAGSRALVDAAAVIGQRFETGVLEAVVPGSAQQVEEALRRGVLIADGSRLGFRHELLRAAVEDSISPPRRAALHARVLAALEAGPSAADSARLAHHAELAGLREQACRYAIQAAGDAQRLGAMREVALQCERALRLGERLSTPERLDLLIQQAHSSNFSSLRMEDALPPAEEAIALARRVGDAVRHGRALIALAYVLWSLDRVVQAKAAADEAVAVLEQTDDVGALAHAHATRVRLVASKLDPEAAIAEGARTLELAERAGLEDIRIDVAISLGLARGHLGEPEALPLLREASLEARERGLAIPTVRSYVNQTFIAAQLRQHAFVDMAAAEARELFGEYQATIPGHAVEIFRARSLLDRGRFDEAQAIALAREDGAGAGESTGARTIRALAAARRGQPGATELLNREWQALQAIPESSPHAMARVALAEDAWLRGNRADALAVHRSARESSAVWRYARPAAELALWSARWGFDFDLPPRAPTAVRLELEGDWRAAIEAWTELEAPYEAALAALPGDDRAARQALAILHRLGAVGAARAFTRERSARGAREARGPRPSTRAHPAGLTRREQHVLEALATGATNAAIAGALHLSERTVAHHVSAILGKLGARTRLAAVEVARERGLLSQNGPPRPPT